MTASAASHIGATYYTVRVSPTESVGRYDLRDQLGVVVPGCAACFRDIATAERAAQDFGGVVEHQRVVISPSGRSRTERLVGSEWQAA
jgi:hypothetical protein